jgi:hypothetical protein
MESMSAYVKVECRQVKDIAANASEHAIRLIIKIESRQVMKLSEAMMLGEVMMPKNNGNTWFGTQVGRYDDCGCAIGRAWFAVGRKVSEWTVTGNNSGFEAEWPWLSGNYAGQISIYFKEVLESKMTFEQLVHHVRSIEPSCGECNHFECTCSANSETTEVSHVDSITQ